MNTKITIIIAVVAVIALSFLGQSKIKKLEKTIEIEKTKSLQYSEELKRAKSEAESYRKKAEKNINEEEIKEPVIVNGKLIGYKTIKKKITNEKQEENASKELLEQLNFAKLEIQHAFEKGYEKAKSEVRPASKRFNLGLGYTLKQQIAIAGGLDFEIIGVQFSLTAIGTVPNTLIDIKSYGLLGLALIHF